MNKDIEIAMDDFYRLKQEYEQGIKMKRRKIKRNVKLEPEQKQQKLAKLVPKCVNCGKPGGTYFSTENSILIARCGATKACSLNIEIKVPRIEKLTDVYSEFEGYVQDSRRDIIRSKLNLLFGYTTEEEALGIFNMAREDLNMAQTYLDEIEHTFENIVHNRRNRVAIKAVEEQLFNSKEQLRQLSKQYDEDGTEQLIRDMVELYINDICPLVTRLRKLKYAYNAVECSNGKSEPCEDDIYHLVQNTYIAQELEMLKNLDESS